MRDVQRKREAILEVILALLIPAYEAAGSQHCIVTLKGRRVRVRMLPVR